MRARAFVLVGVVAALSACAGAGPGPADSADPMVAAADGAFVVRYRPGTAADVRA